VAGVEDFRIVAAFGFAIHLPLAVIEGLIVGVTASYLARVKPEMLTGGATRNPFPQFLARCGEGETENVTSSQSQTNP
jgi:hypothetical protein